MSEVAVLEVGPRDGLQNEPGIVPTARKLAFIRRLLDAGCQEIEVAAFVRPDRVPQMADAAEVFAGLPHPPGVRFLALVPNEKGLERALSAGARHVAFLLAASETFQQRNVGRSVAQSLDEIGRMAAAARQAGCGVRAYLSTLVWCPYEGKIAPEQAAARAEALAARAVDEIALGETLGRATPDEVEETVMAVRTRVAADRLALHLHDTNGRALESVERGLDLGIRRFDGSAGGLGGCPFAPGAAGNLATESLVRLLHARGFATGIDPERIAAAALSLTTGA